ncbi:hypothetical protein ACSBR1_011469 [Camellia fascicularis]
MECLQRELLNLFFLLKTISLTLYLRIESTITESNGSPSMASVCGGCLVLQDAGVPVKCSIAGIAMGLVLDTKEFGGGWNPTYSF